MSECDKPQLVLNGVTYHCDNAHDRYAHQAHGHRYVVPREVRAAS